MLNQLKRPSSPHPRATAEVSTFYLRFFPSFVVWLSTPLATRRSRRFLLRHPSTPTPTEQEEAVPKNPPPCRRGVAFASFSPKIRIQQRSGSPGLHRGEKRLSSSSRSEVLRPFPPLSSGSDGGGSGNIPRLLRSIFFFSEATEQQTAPVIQQPCSQPLDSTLKRRDQSEARAERKERESEKRERGSAGEPDAQAPVQHCRPVQAEIKTKGGGGGSLWVHGWFGPPSLPPTNLYRQEFETQHPKKGAGANSTSRAESGQEK